MDGALRDINTVKETQANDRWQRKKFVKTRTQDGRWRRGNKKATEKLSEAEMFTYMYMVFYSANITYIKLYTRDWSTNIWETLETIKKASFSLPFTEPKVKLKCSPTDKVYSAASHLPLFAIPVLPLADSYTDRHLLVHLWRRGVGGNVHFHWDSPDRPVYLRDIMSQHRGEDINSPLTNERLAMPSIVFPKNFFRSTLTHLGNAFVPY